MPPSALLDGRQEGHWATGPQSLTCAGSARWGLAPIGDFINIEKLEDHDIRVPILGMSHEVTI
jgi:hypothetical protein